MKILVYIDDSPASFSAFYKAMEIVQPEDWIILVGKAHYGRGIGHLSSESMRFFSRVMDKRKIRHLYFLEYGKTKDTLRSKIGQFRIDLALINPYNSKTKKLYDFLNNQKIKTISVSEYTPSDQSLIPRPIDKHAPIPGEGYRKTMMAESGSAIPIHVPSLTNSGEYLQSGEVQQHESKASLPLMASKSAYELSDPSRRSQVSVSSSSSNKIEPPMHKRPLSQSTSGYHISNDPEIENQPTEYNYRQTMPAKHSQSYVYPNLHNSSSMIHTNEQQQQPAIYPADQFYKPPTKKNQTVTFASSPQQTIISK
ncbi:hypothetical protein PPL_06183 [Heterostelium album PN500]|uniref:Uncharacterized protein n=1 Tax=Heterostelium pallidum (strain ATCC 26659 / Pp 5 / PN500) TaxID=670386 RepID=D3BCF8_HETP5|nr:hypothetical protein PPL_06183 [Heterostelium album PN500]EFA80948.1 hypothetical protein PPL_06183 [Heterostelium album PN500]|eukprot:XP_020433066.1 hypothetical protein PPL_06183 [Heterostelium album PN500]